VNYTCHTSGAEDLKTITTLNLSNYYTDQDNTGLISSPSVTIWS